MKREFTEAVEAHMQTPCTLEIERSELELLWYAVILGLNFGRT